MNRGEVVMAILKAIMRGEDYLPDGVPDTPYNWGVWDRMKREIDSLPPGMIVDIPYDWAE